MLRKIFQISLIFLLIMTFSGCSMAGKSAGGFLKSTDGGETFFQEETESGLVLSGLNILSMEINPNNHQEIFVGTSKQGLFKTVDEGKTWLKDVNGFKSVYDIELIPNTSIIYIAVQKNGRSKLLKSENNGEGWLEIYSEKDQSSYLTAVAVHSKVPNVIYIANSKGGLFKSEDSGKTWKNLYWSGSLIDKIELDKVNSNIFYLATERDGLIRSQDGGENFEKIIENGYIYNVISHPDRERFIYVSTKSGLQRSLNGGDDWDMINTLIKPEEIVSRGIAINPQNPREIYFASGLTFYKSANNGKTWSTTQFDSSSSIEMIKVNPSNSQNIYLGVNKRSGGFKLHQF